MINIDQSTVDRHLKKWWWYRAVEFDREDAFPFVINLEGDNVDCGDHEVTDE